MGSCTCQARRGDKKKIEIKIDFICTRAAASISSAYILLSEIGRGSFGVVHQAQSIIGPDHKFAIKTIKKKNFNVSPEQVKQEIETLLILDHPNIIKSYEFFEEKNGIHIVMELCSGGQLLDEFSNSGQMEETEILLYIRSMLRAVNHIHQTGIIHRDLKPENFLFSHVRNHEDLKLVDFGLSNKFNSKFTHFQSAVGTPYYMAPEVLSKDYTTKCDI